MTFKPLLTCLGLLCAQAAHADTDAISQLSHDLAQDLMADAGVRIAIEAGNAAHGELSEYELIALDRMWRREVGEDDQPTIEAVISGPGTERLRAMMERGGGALTEIIVMDKRGMNAAVSSVTSDFWQGDEDKFLRTFSQSPDALHIEDLELDESTGRFQIQVSRTLVDPVTGTSVGAVTFGFDAAVL
ncbi:hypothetical protein SAMN04488020_101295 [Palleronia marisminoris]|uniref:Uncharacterized protein n=1 Tax=Palleronia marisminoris TaxID=315423 RepID=A0A1Y5RHQ6_9RHOB|nr:hypothetical protein [Palleronia marisminoris]SFG14237.1 hypothetical protein SAMN04488020_101295 [Palleronia marisminoris]SLN14937.1 hypothetical protein PAM7066_00296 [Palleronia marisminoris]